MLIEFSVGNYLSVKDIVTFSMVASSIKEHQAINVISANRLNLLKSAVIYGANASGKSNLIKAMSFMKEFVFDSAKNLQVTEDIDVEGFKFSTETENKPSYFEIIFVHSGIRYRYGFEVDNVKVCNEWLFFTPKTIEAKLFIREGNKISLGGYFKEGKGLQGKTRDNALFLSVVAQFNGEIAGSVLQWFTNLNIITGRTAEYMGYTYRKLLDKNHKNRILDLIKLADLDIEDISMETIDFTKESILKSPNLMVLENGLVIVNMYTQHKKYDENKRFLSFETLNLDENESEGTKKLLCISPYLLESLEQGKVLVIDELDAKLHPLLTRLIIKMFNSTNINSLNAQLIFATHDTTLLNKEFFRRDQIWFTEKDRYGCTDLYSLVEYTLDKEKIRNDASFGKDYINGKYGAIPYIGDLTLFEERNED